MSKVFKILLLLFSILSFSQNKQENEIFKKIISHEIEKNKVPIYIECRKPKTSFNVREFKEDTGGITVSEKTLNDFEKNNTDTEETWNSELIKQSEFNPKYIKNTNCLTDEEIEILFKDIYKRQNIISVSKPLFDNDFENCIVSITYSKSFHSASGKSYLLKKTNGIWTIITEFGHWIS
ncbi:hypothetical protein GCM10022422_03770 [Flavobacterium ginsengisoli]|uniref:Uncharacterized protein n=1 Tax=Flavobacterium ginsengisoli TaxID=871694 RepID=A0ABP7EVJ1_9FLAO